MVWFSFSLRTRMQHMHTQRSLSISTIPGVEWTTVDNNVVSTQKICMSGSF